MAFVAPGWQTEDLGEEWVESSPSPPPSTLPRQLAPKTNNNMNTTLTRNMGSVQAKRGSLRGLGHAPARGLPISRASSTPEPVGDSYKHGDQGGKVMARRNTSGMLSPPSSGPDDEQDINDGDRGTQRGEVPAGTFLVREGVDDDRGKHLIRNQAKQKDIFGALPLERLFLPPSPPSVPAPVVASAPPPPPLPAPLAPVDTTPTRPARPAQATPSLADLPSPTQESISLSQASGSEMQDTPPRRVSHQYAPLMPSRLSKSITPSNMSSSFSSSAQPTETHTREIQPDDSVLQDDTAALSEQTTQIHPLAQSTTPNTSPRREEDTSEVPQGEFSFVYDPPSQPLPIGHNVDDEENEGQVEELDGERPTFDPNEISHSTIHGGAARHQPGLRLFRSTYDTYTRDHLSALVDSIAVDQSPSSGSSREQTPGLDQYSAEASGSATGSGSGHTMSSDSRSSKRLRLSPPSPPRRTAMKDWGAQGMRMMDMIRDAGPGSTTSVSQSRTSDEERHDGGEPTPNFRQSTSQSPSQSQSQSQSPTPEPTVSDRGYRPTHRSNPSTTSSGYLRAAEDLMARIKNRGVSESGSNPDSPASRARQILSETDDNAFASSEGDTDSGKAKAKPRTGPSPRRILRRLSASEEIKRIAEGGSDSESGDEPLTTASITQRQAPSLSQNDNGTNGTPTPPRPNPRVLNTDDLNRYLSSSTYPANTNTYTGTTMSTSFVKHQGRPTAPPPAKIRTIRPDDVQGVMSERVGKMRYDQTTMRWVRELGTVDENGESRRESEESEDVFAGMESWRDEVRSLRKDIEDESATEGEGDEDFNMVADRTRHISPSEIDSDEHDEEEHGTTPPSHAPEPAPAPRLYPNPPSISPPTRPMPHHANSAPPIMTPRPASLSPPKLRSALRQPNASTPFNGLKKRTGWHSDLTPAPIRLASNTPGSSGARRSVSFSDGKKHGKIEGADVRVLGGQKDRRADVPADEFFRPKVTVNDDTAEVEQSGEISWMPSARTKRIQGMLQSMDELSLDDHATPSKPSKQDMATLNLAASDNRPADREDEDLTAPIIPFSRRSTRNRADQTGANATFLTECSFGVTHDKLVQLITDVQPFEPYWETLKSIDLRDRAVDNLTRLKEFLPALQEVMLDGNRLSYLSGLPSSVLNLHVANNKLTSLTSVAHLKRIEILDISHNQLDSVYQFACLTNLKELKVDGNSITDLSGISSIEGLVSLSVANNKIKSLDLGRTKWTALETLIVSGNQITEVRGLENLEMLRTIDLDNNKLSTFSAASPMITVRTVRISDNNISSLEMSDFPRLRTLYADGNRISRLSRSRGDGTSRLENLSLRNQRCSTFKLSSSELTPVKRLYISGNKLPTDFFPGSLPNLLYLEAAACSLSTLPPGFAKSLSSLKILNLNYNFLTCLDGLGGLTRLRKLTVVGCRLGGKEKGIVKSLRGLSGLEELDLRMNPSTLSFYLPLFSHHPAVAANTEDTLPRDKSYIQPSTRLQNSVNKRIRDHQATSTTTEAEWHELDGQFRRTLPDEWYGRRLLYRGLVMRACPEVERLDGLEIKAGERKKAEELLLRAGV